MDSDLVKRYAAPVPRYTSYPTAPHFSPNVTAVRYKSWLASLAPHSRLSLYVHIPFCDKLCWYCGCSTKETHRYAPVAAYLEPLHREIDNVAALVPAEHTVTHIHWGGGSPNVLGAPDILRLADALKSRFRFWEGAEFAIEIDPRRLGDDQVEAFSRSGVNRISIGVQDFDERVQAAINREQSYETTKRAIDVFRAAGVPSVNIDLVYGLPHQTAASVARTLEQVLTLRPDRVAAFGYAHLPSRMKAQRLIDETALPGIMARFEQSREIERALKAAGYVPIGLDHFALAADKLAQAELKRNFQGYTTDTADALLGFGASAIGKLPGGYVQNAVAAGDYRTRIEQDGFATVRGLVLTEDDRIRGQVIEDLMCREAFSGSDLRGRFGAAAGEVIAEAEAIVADDPDGLVEATSDGFRITERGRPFVRTICARFDAKLAQSKAQHALAV